MIPDWLRAHLVALGRWDTDGVHRRASAQVCRCGARILVGLDDDMCALPARADPGPLDAPGELQALVQGRATYRLRYVSGKWELDRRSVDDIQRVPAGKEHVLAAHQCGKPIAANGPPIENPRSTRTMEVPECPPF